MLNLNRGIILSLIALVMLGSCTRHEEVTLPHNSVTIEGEIYTVEQQLYKLYDLSYPDGAGGELTEEGIAVRIIADGVLVTADIPTRLLGQTIDLADRDHSPDPDGLFFAFYISQRGDDGLYCRINSWDYEQPKPNDYGNSPYNGWFSITPGANIGEYTFEWELVDRESSNVVSEGFVSDSFLSI